MRFSRWLLAGLAALALNGCAGYHVGPTNGLAAGEKSIQIAFFANKTLEARLGDAVNSALHESFQRDGTYRLATHDDGDIVLNGVITRYQRYELSFVPSDVQTVLDYRVELTAQVTARDRRTGKVIFDKTVSGFALMRVGSDMTSDERQVIPVLAENFAKNATALLVDGSW
jgi:lipopolysaccharide assembly LptE-like protein